MTRRVFSIILFFLLAGLLLSGCEWVEVAAPEAPAEPTPAPSALLWFEDVPVDNDTPLEDLLTVDYPLEELRGWFPEICEQERLAFHQNDDISMPLFAEVNERFPVQCLRWNNNRFYTVYKVHESGFFYVFWATFFSPVQVPDEPVIKNPGKVNCCFYFNEQPSEADFSVLVPGESTGADVKVIDPAMEWGLLYSSGDRSFSLLADGRILVVFYQRPELPKDFSAELFKGYQNTDEFVFSRIEIDPKISSDSALAAILPEDLPE